jgi:glycosyltransferase involved in cell wall biosynthesis
MTAEKQHWHPIGDLSVIVPVRDEVDNLGPLLDDLRAQHQPAVELVVVDAGSTDGTRELLSNRASRWDRLRVVHADGAPPGHARNEGIKRTSSHLIATLDAGTRVGPEWLAALSAPLRAVGADHPLVCVGIAEPDARSEFERAAGWLTLRAFKPLGRPAPASASYLPGGRNGLCFDRRVWERVGGYPADLRWGEDKLFLERLRAAGIEVRTVPDARVRWRPRRSLRELFRQYEDYGRGDAIARLDRQNELIPLALYWAAAALGVAAFAGSAVAGVVLAILAAAYLGLFTAAAWRTLGPSRALAWVPVIRIAVDLAKIRGFLSGLRVSLTRRSGFGD